MTTFFYDHLIEPERIEAHLSRIDAQPHERDHVVAVVRSTIHHDIMDAVLGRLPDDYKDSLLDHVALDKHDEALALLAQHIHDLEVLVRHIADVHIAQLEEDVAALVTESATSDAIL